MRQLEIAESIYNITDVSVFIKTIKNVFKKRIEMDVTTFLKRLIQRSSYTSLTPPQLTRQLDQSKNQPIVIDLRDEPEFKQGHIEGAIWHPFDDFLGHVLMEEGYHENKSDGIVLVCDTGFKSIVAATILMETGFSDVFSLNRGMHRWFRWKHLLARCEKTDSKPFRICKSIFNI